MILDNLSNIPLWEWIVGGIGLLTFSGVIYSSVFEKRIFGKREFKKENLIIVTAWLTFFGGLAFLPLGNIESIFIRFLSVLGWFALSIGSGVLFLTKFPPKS